MLNGGDRRRKVRHSPATVIPGHTWRSDNDAHREQQRIHNRLIPIGKHHPIQGVIGAQGHAPIVVVNIAATLTAPSRVIITRVDASPSPLVRPVNSIITSR